ncbi:hypothetical protein LX16_1944 [Stackebrandtia albiflava]|uniref:Uncharacterized protein n=1 Tax=Stackebrandtia albiflava TaxID=406432 RepID=A0A562VEH6_9ACTN|nr:DUF6886 family protein [Stackebrandtia albiflava]TWJ16217.1 hypothetical protein LX16_1944 [Stackebrandtia albiflava]
MRPRPGELLHFSEDPHIDRFTPRRAATQRVEPAYVWAVDHARSCDYWFPRHCPRAMAWAEPDTTPADRDRLLGPGAPRVHTVEYGWLAAMADHRLFAYRMPAEAFRPLGPAESAVYGAAAWVSTSPVTPLGPAEPVGDLFALHAEADIQLRVVDRLWPWWDEVVGSTAGFSGIRLRNALPRRDGT